MRVAYVVQVTTLRDFFQDETVFVAFGAEKCSPEQLTLSDEGRHDTYCHKHHSVCRS